MTNIDKINAKVDQMNDTWISDGNYCEDTVRQLRDALRIAVEGLEAIGQQSGGRRVDPILCAIAAALEGKP